MMVKKSLLLCMLLALLLLLCSCTSSIPVASNESTLSLPEETYPAQAPVGDAELVCTQKTLMYFPSYDDISLSSVEEEVEFASTRSREESIVRAMLDFSGTGRCDSLGGDVRLTLEGKSPVERSRNTVIIHLGASALRLSRSRLYLVGQAFANTLCQGGELSYVSLLVSGKSIGMDVGNSLPMGAFEATQERDINALYKQKTARKASDDSSQYFMANVTLLYPLSGMDALICNTQSISFSSQKTEDMVQAILSKLALGLGEGGSLAPQLPLLNDFLTYIPTVIESEEAGGSVLQLDFAQNLEDMLAAYQVSKDASMASLCRTLCGFIPGLVGIRVSIEGSPTDSTLLYANPNTQEHGVLYLSKEISVPVYHYAKLYFMDENGKPAASLRPMACGDCLNPRKLLLELAKGPQEGDSLSGLKAIMPENVISDWSIIGLAIDGSTLLVNFSPSFGSITENMTGTQEQCFVYCMVGTLCTDPSVQSVAFFMGGEQFDGFGKEVYWKGVFYPIFSEETGE